MGNDIEIRVRVANNTAAGLTAVNNSLRRLRDEARDAGHGLDGLTTRAAAATVALRALKDSAQDAARALRSLNTAARNADGRLDTMSQRSRTLRRDTDDLDESMRRLTGTMGDLRGSLGSVNLTANGRGMDNLRKAALLLSPALIPIAAAAVPVAANLAAAGVAVGAFGLALGGQVAEMAKAGDAEKKYNEAVKEHGRSSNEAAKAEAKYLAAMRDMDPATRRAAAAFTVFKDSYKDWSKSLASDTMPVVTKGFATFGALLPRLTPMVRATSGELDRLMTVLAGGVNSSGFERFMNSFAQFASGALSKATDGLVRFMRTMSGGGGSSQFSEFMAYVREVGPQVGETLGNLGQALAHLVAAASDVGVGILGAVNALAKLVNAIPTETLSNLLQFVVVLKAVKLAAAGLGGAGGALAGFGAQLAAMTAASAAAGGGLAGLAAAFGALSRAAKVALIGSGIGILVVALSELSEMGRTAPPDVDKLTSSLRQLGAEGKVVGEAAKHFGSDLDGLYGKIRSLTDPSTVDNVQQFIVTLGGLGDWDSTPVKEAKENLDAIDKSLAGLVKNGQADLAAEALKQLTAEYGKGGRDTKEFTKNLDDYEAALADARFEQELAASAMGLFGDQAVAVGEKLAAQKASADGLRQSIQALSDTSRGAFDAQTRFEEALDKVTESIKENGRTLDIGSEKGRANRDALSALASATQDAAAKARENGASWQTVAGIYDKGRKSLVDNAFAITHNREEAERLADTLMKMPSKTMRLEMRTEDAVKSLNGVVAAMKKTPNAKSVTVRALTKDAISLLQEVGLKVTRLKDGRFRITANGKPAEDVIGAVKRARDGLKSKTITLAARDHASAAARAIQRAIAALRSKTVTITTVRQTIARYSTDTRPTTGQGGVSKYAEGGPITGGSGTKDDVPILAMGGEFIVNKRQARKYQSLLEAINNDELPRFAKGGKVSKRAKAEAEARRGAMGDLTISHFGRMAGYKTSEIIGQLGRADSLGDLVNSLNKWRSIIKAATHGAQEKGLLKALDSAGKKLLAWEKQLGKVEASLGKAKDKLNDLKSAASQLSGSVKSGILSSANITRGASGDGPVTVASIMGGLTASRDKATAFSKALADLKKKGLSSALLQQIAEAGIEGGGLETAGALLPASGSEIKSLNSLQSQIGKAAGSAGKTTSDAVFGAQIKAQQAYVDKLTKSQDRLEKSMEKLAKSMEKLIEKAFKGKAAGGIVGAAASGGIRSNLTWVGEQGPELLDLAPGSRVWSNPDSRRMQQQAWASMLNEPRMRHAQGRAAVAGAGGRREPIVIELRSSGSDVDEFLLKCLRRAIKARGSDVEFVLTGRRSS